MNIFDIIKLIEVCQNPRDKAIVACLFESNTRPKEFFNLCWKEIQYEKIDVKMWDGNGAMINQQIDVIFLNIEGKTGPRRTFLFFSAPYLLAWKNARPHTPDDHIWIDLENDLEQLKYPAARKIINTLANRCDLEKYITPYSFRHGRNTEVCEVLSYAQHCEYAGWHQGSDMPKVYNHLSGLNTVAPILGEYGVVVERRQAIREAWIQLYQKGLKLFSGK